MRMILALAMMASLSACAAFGAHPTTAASVAKAADRAIKAEKGYAQAAALTQVTVPALGAGVRAQIAQGDNIAYTALTAARLTYPLALTLTAEDAVQLGAAIAAADLAHHDLQGALAAPG